MNSTDRYNQFRSIGYFGSLDALRCLAIVAVIWQHSPAIPHDAMPLTDAGASGVALFFVLSGFLITTLLLREDEGTGGISLRNFYMRRTLRIFPLYYAVLGLYALLVALLEHNAAGRLFFQNLPYYLTYTTNWFVDLKLNEDGQRRVIFVFAWSLATEEQFYLFWPPIMKFCRRAVAISILLAVVFVDLALTFAFGIVDVPETTVQRLLRIAQSPSTEICFGVLLAIALHAKAGFAAAWRVLGKQWSAPATLVLLAAIAMWPGGATPGWYLAQAMALTAFLAACVIREDHGVAAFLTTPFLARVGVVSYGMYLLHMLSVNSVKVIFARIGVESAPALFVLAVLAAYFSAEMSYRLFESPILRLKKRFGSRQTVGR